MLNIRRRSKNFAMFAFATTYILWGINTPFIKISLESVPLFVLLCFKFIIAGLFLLIYKPKKWKRLSPVMWLRILLATIIGVTLQLILNYSGLKRTGGISASLIYLLEPIAIYFLSVEMLKERLNSKILFGVIVSLTGAALVVASPLLRGGSTDQGSFVGNMMILLGVAASALGSILIKPLLRTVPSKQMTIIRFLMVGIMLLPWAIHDVSKVNIQSLSHGVLLAVGYNIVFASIIGYSLYHYSFNKISGEQSSPFMYLDPLAGVVGSMVILHEQLTPVMLFGGLLVIIGIYMSEAKRSFWRTFH